MVRILSEPRNALTKQYHKLLEMEDVELVFEPGALEAIADLAIKRKTGARGLRSILETRCATSCSRSRRWTTCARSSSPARPS